MGIQNQEAKYQGQPNWRCKPHRNPNAMHLMGPNKGTSWRSVLGQVSMGTDLVDDIFWCSRTKWRVKWRKVLNIFPNLERERET